MSTTTAETPRVCPCGCGDPVPERTWGGRTPIWAHGSFCQRCWQKEHPGEPSPGKAASERVPEQLLQGDGSAAATTPPRRTEDQDDDWAAPREIPLSAGDPRRRVICSRGTAGWRPTLRQCAMAWRDGEDRCLLGAGGACCLGRERSWELACIEGQVCSLDGALRSGPARVHRGEGDNDCDESRGCSLSPAASGGIGPDGPPGVRLDAPCPRNEESRALAALPSGAAPVEAAATPAGSSGGMGAAEYPGGGAVPAGPDDDGEGEGDRAAECTPGDEPSQIRDVATPLERSGEGEVIAPDNDCDDAADLLRGCFDRMLEAPAGPAPAGDNDCDGDCDGETEETMESETTTATAGTPPTCQFFQCTRPARPNFGPGKSWCSYCDEHAGPNPLMRSEMARRRWERERDATPEEEPEEARQAAPAEVEPAPAAEVEVTTGPALEGAADGGDKMAQTVGAPGPVATDLAPWPAQAPLPNSRCCAECRRWAKELDGRHFDLLRLDKLVELGTDPHLLDQIAVGLQGHLPTHTRAQCVAMANTVAEYARMIRMQGITEEVDGLRQRLGDCQQKLAETQSHCEELKKDQDLLREVVRHRDEVVRERDEARRQLDNERLAARSYLGVLKDTAEAAGLTWGEGADAGSCVEVLAETVEELKGKAGELGRIHALLMHGVEFKLGRVEQWAEQANRLRFASPSQICHETHCQNCSHCEAINCCDNTSPAKRRISELESQLAEARAAAEELVNLRNCAINLARDLDGARGQTMLRQARVEQLEEQLRLQSSASAIQDLPEALRLQVWAAESQRMLAVLRPIAELLTPLVRAR